MVNYHLQENDLKAITMYGYLRIGQVLSLIPIGRSTWWKWVAEGKAPRPIKLGPRTTAWKVQDIEALIDSLSNEEGA